MNVLKKIARHAGELSPNCKEAVRLQSLALDQPLPFFPRLGLQIHVLLCKWCRRYQQQIHFLRLAARRCDDHETLAPLQTLSPGARARIRQRLQAGK